MGRDTESWAFANFPDEFRSAMRDPRCEEILAHSQGDWILLHWLLLDRELDSGGTAAERYAALTGLSASDRDVATRVAASRPGIHRVVAREPGAWLELEDVLRGGRTRTRSATLSRATVVWDVLVARVMTGPRGASLWGPVAIFEPGEEDELVAQVDRLSAGEDLDLALRRQWRDLVTFSPPSRERESELLDAEGDPLVAGHAAWGIVDDEDVFERLGDLFEYIGEDDQHVDVFDWLIPRAEVLARRPLSVDGALYFESSPSEHPGMVSVATFRLYADELVLTTRTSRRLDLAVKLITSQLGGLARLTERNSSAIDPKSTQAGPPATPQAANGAASPQVATAAVRQYLTEWIDTPLACLDGLTPRVAASRPEHRRELERLLRGIENRAARNRARGEPWPEVDFVRCALSQYPDARLAA